MNTIPTTPLQSEIDKPALRTSWTRHLGAVLATTLIFVSGTSFMSLLDAFH
ncbi:MAG: hypothetical protein JNM76_07710 [Betaproteobacteria bacterium]|nr:hypothetical protein [Betaproteobacteria bacterium]